MSRTAEQRWKKAGLVMTCGLGLVLLTSGLFNGRGRSFYELKPPSLLFLFHTAKNNS